MANDKTPVYKFWNGKNLEGGSRVGDKDLIGEGPRHGKTNAKYEVGNDTVAADDLQKTPR
jgi:hypothetical protein